MRVRTVPVAAARHSGYRPPFMAEELRLQQMIRKVGTTHFDQGLIAPGLFKMDGGAPPTLSPFHVRRQEKPANRRPR